MRLLFALLTAGASFAQTPNLDQLKKDAIVNIDGRSKMVQEIVDSVFSFGELGFQEVETSKYLTAILEKNGFQIERGVAGIPTAWVATWSNGGKPVIGFITDLDGIPRANQKPGVAYHDPLIDGAPGHGEGHNSGNAVNIVAALALKDLMTRHNIKGTLKLFPGIAEELLGTKAFYVRAGLVSIQYTFKSEAAHAVGAPWKGRSPLDGGDQPNVVPEEATV